MNECVQYSKQIIWIGHINRMNVIFLYHRKGEKTTENLKQKINRLLLFKQRWNVNQFKVISIEMLISEVMKNFLI